MPQVEQPLPVACFHAEHSIVDAGVDPKLECESIAERLVQRIQALDQDDRSRQYLDHLAEAVGFPIVPSVAGAAAPYEPVDGCAQFAPSQVCNAIANRCPRRALQVLLREGYEEFVGSYAMTASPSAA
jgi:hypothetical protein